MSLLTLPGLLALLGNCKDSLTSHVTFIHVISNSSSQTQHVSSTTFICVCQSNASSQLELKLSEHKINISNYLETPYRMYYMLGCLLIGDVHTINS